MSLHQYPIGRSVGPAELGALVHLIVSFYCSYYSIDQGVWDMEVMTDQPTNRPTDGRMDLLGSFTSNN